ncbi:MAG: hypothetical protein AAF160_20050 [Pseudomonadota bacterium]
MIVPRDIAAAAVAELEAEIAETEEATTLLRAARARLDESMRQARNALAPSGAAEDAGWREATEFAEPQVRFQGPGDPESET